MLMFLLYCHRENKSLYEISQGYGGNREKFKSAKWPFWFDGWLFSLGCPGMLNSINKGENRILCKLAKQSMSNCWIEWQKVTSGQRFDWWDRGVEISTMYISRWFLESISPDHTLLSYQPPLSLHSPFCTLWIQFFHCLLLAPVSW